MMVARNNARHDGTPGPGPSTGTPAANGSASPTAVDAETVDDVEALRERVRELESKLEEHKLIDRAKSALMEEGLSEAEAYARMRKASMDSRRPLRDVAEAVCLSKLVRREDV